MRRDYKMATAVLLNWKRQDNIDTIIKSIRKQSVSIRIGIWHNGITPAKHFDCDDFYIASRNHVCWPRWFVAAQAKTEYVFCMDDDLCFASEFALQNIIEQHERFGRPGTVTGVEGVRLRSGCGYFPTYPRPWMRSEITKELKGSSVHLGYVAEPTHVDIVKGRFMLMRTVDLRLPMILPGHQYADDIIVCGVLARRRKHPHLLAATPRSHFSDLEGKNGEMALSNLPEVLEAREASKRAFFSHI